MRCQSWLSSSNDVLLGNLPQLEPIVVERSFPDCRLPCDYIDEPLVEIEGMDCVDAYFKLGILPPRKPLLRSGLIARLALAQEYLPEGFGLVVLDAWRSLYEQDVLIRHYGAEAKEGGFVASTNVDKMRPPHTTGGAVDITLSWNGKALALGTEFDDFDVKSAVDFYEKGADTKVKILRRVLANAMRSSGFAPYWSEWWHWSFGDDMWGWINGKNALYDVVATE